jgi:hypothetical protein
MLFNTHGPWTITLYSLFIPPSLPTTAHPTSTFSVSITSPSSHDSHERRHFRLPWLGRTPFRRHCSLPSWVIDHPDSASLRLRGLKLTRHLEFRVGIQRVKLERSGRHPTGPGMSYLRRLVVPRGLYSVSTPFICVDQISSSPRPLRSVYG